MRDWQWKEYGWGGRIRTSTSRINSAVSYRLDHAPVGCLFPAGCPPRMGADPHPYCTRRCQVVNSKTSPGRASETASSGFFALVAGFGPGFYDGSELFFEVAIALSSISLLTQARVYWKVSFLAAAAAVTLMLALCTFMFAKGSGLLRSFGNNHVASYEP